MSVDGQGGESVVSVDGQGGYLEVSLSVESQKVRVGGQGCQRLFC